jgi:hypothetical protein
LCPTVSDGFFICTSVQKAGAQQFGAAGRGGSGLRRYRIQQRHAHVCFQSQNRHLERLSTTLIPNFGSFMKWFCEMMRVQASECSKVSAISLDFEIQVKNRNMARRGTERSMFLLRGGAPK